MWPKHLSLATFAYNKFKSPNLGNYSPYELTFGRKPRPLIKLDSNPDIKVSGTFREDYAFLDKRIKYLQNILFNFKSKRLAMINKDRAFFQYKSRHLVYIISPLTSQLHTASQKVTIKLMTLDGRILRGLFKHERLKSANIRMSQGNVQNLA